MVPSPSVLRRFPAFSPGPPSPAAARDWVTMVTASGRKSRRTPLGTDPGFRSIKSRYGGRCDHCGRKILVNQTISWMPGHTFHLRCAPTNVTTTIDPDRVKATRRPKVWGR